MHGGNTYRYVKAPLQENSVLWLSYSHNISFTQYAFARRLRLRSNIAVIVIFTRWLDNLHQARNLPGWWSQPNFMVFCSVSHLPIFPAVV